VEVIRQTIASVTWGRLGGEGLGIPPAAHINVKKKASCARGRAFFRRGRLGMANIPQVLDTGVQGGGKKPHIRS